MPKVPDDMDACRRHTDKVANRRQAERAEAKRQRAQDEAELAVMAERLGDAFDTPPVMFVCRRGK